VARAASLDVLTFCEWLLEHFGDDPRVLSRTLCESGLQLLEAITLALKGRRLDEQLELADERLIALRTLLRLAGNIRYLTDSQMLYALEQADVIGRQLGGWIKKAQGPI
jgi:hypothetical protein